MAPLRTARYAFIRLRVTIIRHDGMMDPGAALGHSLQATLKYRKPAGGGGGGGAGCK